jgi:polysaccharide biosynthesis transport protein
MSNDNQTRRPPREEHPYGPGYGAYGSGYGGAAGDSGIGGLGLGQAARAVGGRWYLPVVGAILLLGAAWHFVPHDTVRYSATAVVRLEDPRQGLAGGIVGAPPNMRTADFMISQVHIIRSNAVVGLLVDSLGLRLQPSRALEGRLEGVRVADDASAEMVRLDFEAGGFAVEADGRSAYGLYGEPVEVSGVRFTIASQPPADSGRIEVVSREAAIQRVVAGTSASPRARTSIIDVTYIDTEPLQAQRIVNALVEEYQTYNTAGVREAARRRRAFIEQQWQSAEARYEWALRQLAQFRTRSQAYSEQDRMRRQQQALVSADEQRQSLEHERRVYLQFLDRVAQTPEDRIYEELRTLVLAPGIASSPLLSQLYTQVTQHQLDRDRLLAAGRAPTHPEVERLGRMMASARASVMDAARGQLASLDLRLATITEQRQQGVATLQNIPDTEIEYIALEQEVTVARGLADGLRSEFHRARIAEAVDVGQAQVLDLASGALTHPSGRRTQKLLLAIMIGLLAGCTVALGLEVSNGSVRWRADMEELSAVPGLAVIPRVSSGWSGRSGRSGLFGRSKPGPSKSGMDKESLPAIDFHTQGAEAYRILRTNLTFLRRDESLRIITVTSAESGEGKSTTAANLAVSMAQQDTRVLLVDCDLRRPRQHKIFGMLDRPGFSEVLLGSAEVAGCVHATPIDNLWLMPRGQFNERAADNLGTPRMNQLLAALREDYDVVIIDTPPVLVAADAAAISGSSDGVLLVVRAGRTPRDAARRTMQQLQAVGANVVGFVLNDPDTTAGKYGEYSYSRSYYAVEA